MRVAMPAVLLLNADSVIAETASEHYEKWLPQLDFNAKYGNKRNIGRVGAFAPLAQNNDMLSYLDLRFMGDSRDNKEINAGLGQRWIDRDADRILGVFAYYDRRFSELGNAINQITLGAEYLTSTWDYRLNTHTPLKAKFSKKRQPKPLLSPILLLVINK